MLDPQRSCKWAKSPMGHMIQFKDRVWFAPREVFEIDGQTKSAHQIEGVVFEPCGDVDGFVLVALKLLDKLVDFLVD